MKTIYSYRGLEILHTVKPRMKNIYFRIGEEQVVRVNSSKISKKYLFELIDERMQWIMAGLEKSEHKKSMMVGKEILYLGEIHLLCEDERFQALHLKCINSDTQKHLTYYQDFYKGHAQKYLAERLAYFAALMQLQPKEMRLRRMKRQWGNCRSNGIITFNIHLMQTPQECIDYVVVHELAHLVHMNHSKAFHNLVEQYLPQSRAKRTRLKMFSASITL